MTAAVCGCLRGGDSGCRSRCCQLGWLGRRWEYVPGSCPLPFPSPLTTAVVAADEVVVTGEIRRGGGCGGGGARG